MRVGRVLACAAVVCLGAATGAHAGTYTVSYANGSGCGLFTAMSGTAVTAQAPCSEPTLAISTTSTPVNVSDGAAISTTAPAGVAIIAADPDVQLFQFSSNNSLTAVSFHDGGVTGRPWSSDGPIPESGFSTSVWGFNGVCENTAGCSGSAVIVASVTLTASEDSGPTVSADQDSLASQSGYVWNPPGDPWPIGFSSSDPSGVCSLSATVNGATVNGPAATPDTTAWHQCPDLSWTAAGGATVDTRQSVPGDGPLTLALNATNAAGVTSSPSQTVQVDNDPIAVSLATPDDDNPTLWVNHAVTVQAAAAAGPSGIAGTTCTVDGGPSSTYPSGGLTVDGDGVHTVACTAANGAVDPQGQPNTGTATQAIKIDEVPPATSFAPVDPSDPTKLAVNAPDAESGLATGTITIQGPHAKSAKRLSTSVVGSQLLSRFSDATKHGTYTFTATGCDLVGNCSSATERLRFPIRLGTRSLLSFAKLRAPGRTVRERVRVGYHVKTVRRRLLVGYHLKSVRGRRHGHRVIRHIKVGGHYRDVTRRIKVGGRRRRITLVIPTNRRCAHRRIKTGRHRWREISVCREIKLHAITRHRVHFGQAVRVHGLLTTAQGAPIRDARVRVLTRPHDRGGIFRHVSTVHTDAAGRWVARLRGGPSRSIRAYYPGSPTVEPVSSYAHLTVPAKIRLHISPHVLPWSHRITITGHLVGRYVPHDGVALRLLVRYPHAKRRTPLLALRTNRHGAFDFTWTYHAGRGVATYPFSIATTATETDYPYAAGNSPSVKVTFGRRTPRHRRPR